MKLHVYFTDGRKLSFAYDTQSEAMRRTTIYQKLMDDKVLTIQSDDGNFVIPFDNVAYFHVTEADEHGPVPPGAIRDAQLLG